MKGFTILLFIVFMGAPSFTWAQDKGAERKAMQQIEAARIAMITERLGLTPDQAQSFWPLYNEFSDRRREIRSQLNEARKGIDPNNLSEEESQRLMDLGLEIKQSEVNLEREYTGKFRNVISSQQILSLRRAEEDFRKLILQRIEERRRQQLNRQNMLQRQEIQRQRGNN